MSRLLKSEEPVTTDKAHPDATIRTPRAEFGWSMNIALLNPATPHSAA